VHAWRIQIPGKLFFRSSAPDCCRVSQYCRGKRAGTSVGMFDSLLAAAASGSTSAALTSATRRSSFTAMGRELFGLALLNILLFSAGAGVLIATRWCRKDVVLRSV